MSNIPLARERLMEIADTIRAYGAPSIADQIAGIVEGAMYREPYIRRAPSKSKSVTPATKAKIRKLYDEHDDMSQQDIAEAVGTNIGRVSEVLNRKR
jgi:Zn-dependent M16 (insulinase) family peptidase